MRGDGDSAMSRPPSLLGARRRLGCRTANGLGARVVSSIPEQLSGHETASARRDTKMAQRSLLRHRRCQGPLGRDGVAGGVVLVGS